MKRQAVSSRAISSIGYQAGTLEVEFVDGDVYRYFLVPRALFIEFMQAESKGAFFNDRIRDRFPTEGPL
jgi:KTSC domain